MMRPSSFNDNYILNLISQRSIKSDEHDIQSKLPYHWTIYPVVLWISLNIGRQFVFGPIAM